MAEAIRDSTADSIEWVPIETITPDPRNSRRHPDEQIEQLRASFRQFGWVWPCLIRENGTLIAGEGRWRAARLEGATQAKVLRAEGMSAAQIRAFVIADNQLPMGAEWDDSALRAELEALQGMDFDMAAIGFNAGELERILLGEMAKATAGSLAISFGIPPFSVFNAREGWWQDRKEAWLALGIQSELGRGENLQGLSDTNAEYMNREGRFNAQPGRHGRSPDTENPAQFTARITKENKKTKKANAIPGGRLMPTVNPKTGKICRADSRSRPVKGTDAKRAAP